MDYPLVCTVVGVCEENRPIRRQGGDVNRKAVVLRGDETATTVVMETRLIVSSVTVPARG